MQQTTIVVLGATLIAVIAVVALVRGVVTKRPPGQRGLRGTAFHDHSGLYRVQMGALTVLLIACVGVVGWMCVR